ncbi:unnamed protein product [Pieris brassicae]|uniref:Uncharacterized protein n=1 Tax=Pieris brassicae TaxID=7116 RepID=A0A9P0T9S9_PIEBR|nr:unnamed protein product [Pieris brassicae]
MGGRLGSYALRGNCAMLLQAHLREDTIPYKTAPYRVHLSFAFINHLRHKPTRLATLLLRFAATKETSK